MIIFLLCIYFLLVSVSLYVAFTYDNIFAAASFLVLVVVIPVAGGLYSDYKLKQKMETKCEEIGVVIIRGIETPVYYCEK